MCKADSSEILSSFEVVLPPSILDTCQRLRPGISTCFLAVNKQEGTSSQITVAKQNDKSVVLRVAVMALGKSRSEKKLIEATEGTETGEPIYEEQLMEEGETYYRQEETEVASEIVGERTPIVKRKPGPAFTKKPGYRKGQSSKQSPKVEASPDAMPKLQKAPATYQNMHRPSTILSVKKKKVDSGKGRARYIPTKLDPPTLEKSQDLHVATKQPAERRFSKTQATIAAIEAANKKTPTYIGNLATSRRIPEMHVPPPRPRMMPVLQRENNLATGNYETPPKTPAGRGKHKRPTQPYGQPRPAGMNKSLTKMWSQKRKRGPKKGAASRSSSISDTTGVTTEVVMEGGVSEPFQISGSESTIIITVNEGKISTPLEKTEILHHKKRWAAANARNETNEEYEEEEESEEEEGVLKFEDAEASLGLTADGTPAPKKRRRGPKKPKCRLCSTKFMEYHFLFRHVQRKHKTNEGEFYLEEVRALVKYNCPGCSQEFPSEEELAEHTKEGCQSPENPSLSETPQEPPALSPASKTGPSGSEQPQTLTSSVPQKVVDNKGKLPRHKTVGGEYRHTCRYCKKGFNLQDNMNKHIQAVHEKNKIRKHKCPRCGKQFNLKSTMLQHVQGSHPKQMPYHCPMCQTGFRRMKTLTSHVEKCKGADSNPKKQPTVPLPATIGENGS